MTFPAVIDPFDLNGSNGFRIGGGSTLGFAVASAGDINADGFNDIIVSGSSTHVIFGNGSSFPVNFDVNNLDGSNGFSVVGNNGGLSSSAGDINGDGINDILVANTDFGGGRGAVYVVFGKSTVFGTQIDLTMLGSGDGFRIDGISPGDYSGQALASAGDINGDGFDDILIGARFATRGGETRVGESYVVFGKAIGSTVNIDLATLDGNNGFHIRGNDPYDNTGSSVAPAGDINGDGFDDIIIGSVGVNGYAGSTYVIFGKASGFSANFSPASLDGSNGFRLNGIDASDLSGNSVSSAGDINGDGFDDILIGAYGGDPDGNGNAGESYIVFGKGNSFTPSIDLAALDGNSGFRIEGVAAGDLSGASVSAAGDINADGFDDIVIGAPAVDFIGTGFGDDIGSVYVVFGRSGGFSSVLSLAALDGANGFEFTRFEPNAALGRAISGLGDISGDGIDDIVIGAPFANVSGEAYVIFGRQPGQGVVRTGSSGDETLTGGSGNDTLLGLGGNDRLDGGSGADVLSGSLGQDTMTGGAGSDRFFFNGGNESPGVGDLITDFQSGSDVIDVSGIGLGDLTLQSVAGGQVLKEASGSDPFTLRIQGGVIGADIFTGGAGINIGDDTFSGTISDDIIEGGDGADLLSGGLGQDTLSGSAGDDLLDGGGQDDLLLGGAGNDTLIGSAGEDTLDGGTGNDNVRGSVRSDRILGGDGNDTLAGNNGDDVIDGGAGVDLVLGGPGNDLIGGGEGDDILNGNNGEDSIDGGAGGDVVFGGALADSILGGSGGDDLKGNAGNDMIRGGTGGDNILGQANSDLLYGDANNDTIGGNGANDSVFGGDGADLLRGNAGDDIVYGEAGADQLLGGNGDDVIVGGAGEDRLAGNNGRDVFLFNTGDSGASFASADFITDFSQAENDVIRLVGIDAIAGGNDDAFSFIGTSAFSGTAGELRYEQTGGRTNIFGDTDGDGSADFALQLLGTIDLVAGDFVL